MDRQTTHSWIVLISTVLCAVLAPTAHAKVLVSREQNAVYHLDCATGLILCTSSAFSPLSSLEALGFDAHAWRRLRTATANSSRSENPRRQSWLPTHDSWRGVSSRGTTELNPDPSQALESLPRPVVARLGKLWQDRQRSKLDHVALQLELRARDIDLLQIMQSVAALFGTRTGQPPDIVLIATTDSRRGSIATRNARFLFVESPRDDTGRNRLPVVAHEWTHHLFEQMSHRVAADLLNGFEQSQARCTTPAYHLLEEVIATAVGDGIIAARLYQSTDDTAYRSTSESFYADPDIDAMAKAILPLLTRQLSSGAPLNGTFAADYIALAEQVLGSRCVDLQARMRMSAIVQSGPNFEAPYQLLRDRLEIRTALIDVVNDGDSSATALAQYRGLTGVVLSDVDGLYRLEGIANRPIRQALAAVASAEGAAVFAWPRNPHAEIYFIVGKNPAATALAAVHFLAQKRQRFRGWWLPLNGDSIPE